MTRKSPLPLRLHIQVKAASTSVPPPMSTVPDVVIAIASEGLPTRKYWYVFLGAAVATPRNASTAAMHRTDLFIAALYRHGCPAPGIQVRNKIWAGVPT